MSMVSYSAKEKNFCGQISICGEINTLLHKIKSPNSEEL